MNNEEARDVVTPTDKQIEQFLGDTELYERKIDDLADVIEHAGGFDGYQIVEQVLLAGWTVTSPDGVTISTFV